jgi:hypothetical protein
MSITAKIGSTPQTLHGRVNTAEIDSGQRAGVPTRMADGVKAGHLNRWRDGIAFAKAELGHRSR